MKRLALTTAFIIAAAAPAFANDQLARSLGLEPGVYSPAELAQIKGAIENRETDNSFHVQQLIGRGNSGVVSTQSVGGAGNAQLARSLGLEPGVYSDAELARIKGVAENRETDNAFHLKSVIERAAGA